jgi:hypothetical protein
VHKFFDEGGRYQLIQYLGAGEPRQRRMQRPPRDTRAVRQVAARDPTPRCSPALPGAALSSAPPRLTPCPAPPALALDRGRVRARAGSCGCVALARDVATGELVAIKQLVRNGARTRHSRVPDQCTRLPQRSCSRPPHGPWRPRPPLPPLDFAHDCHRHPFSPIPAPPPARSAPLCAATTSAPRSSTTAASTTPTWSRSGGSSSQRGM